MDGVVEKIFKTLNKTSFGFVTHSPIKKQVDQHGEIQRHSESGNEPSGKNRGFVLKACERITFPPKRSVERPA